MIEKEFIVNDLVKIGIWVVVIGVIFAFAWRKGYLQRLSLYVQQTREELRKCTWPTWDELKGSTVLVAISIFLLGGFTVAVDWVFVHVMFLISRT
jgi:preprotein translocase subunit SecE